MHKFLKNMIDGDPNFWRIVRCFTLISIVTIPLTIYSDHLDYTNARREYAHAKQVWGHATYGRVTDATDPAGKPSDAWTRATIEYQDRAGSTHTIDRLMPWRYKSGRSVTMWVNAEGRVIVRDDLNRYWNGHTPWLSPDYYVPGIPGITGLFGGVILGAILWGMLELVIYLVRRAKRSTSLSPAPA